MRKKRFIDVFEFTGHQHIAKMIDSDRMKSDRMSLIQRICPLGFRRDAYKLIQLAFSLSISYVLTIWMIGAVSLMFMSRQGQTVFNACSLANTASLLISYSLLLGCNYGCDTLIPQYYGGEKRMMSVILQRAIIIFFVYLDYLLDILAQCSKN